jgi:hypothetical protein
MRGHGKYDTNGLDPISISSSMTDHKLRALVLKEMKKLLTIATNYETGKRIKEAFSKTEKASQLVPGKESGRGKNKDRQTEKTCYVCRSKNHI